MKGKQSIQAKRRLKQLTKQNQELNRKLAVLKDYVVLPTETAIVPAVNPNNNAAGNAFGGRNSMHT